MDYTSFFLSCVFDLSKIQSYIFQNGFYAPILLSGNGIKS